MDDDRSGAAAIRRADRLAGVQQPPLFGKQRRDLFENLPVARLFDPGLRLREVRQVHREAADHRAGGVVQLDARGQALGGQAGLRPGEEGGVDRRRAGHRRIAGAHERVQRFHAIDLLQGALQLPVHILPLVQHLRRVAGFDQFLSRAQRGINQGRVEHQRRQRDREERHQQLRRLANCAASSAHSGSPPTPPPRQRRSPPPTGHRGSAIGNPRREEENRRR